MEKQLANDETAQGLPEQFSIVGQGAQYIVAMLTGPEQDVYREFWLDETPAPRVIKIPLPREYVHLAVENMRVDVDQREEKVARLINSREIHMIQTLLGTYFDEELWNMLGRPRRALVPDSALDASQRSYAVFAEGGNYYATDPCCYTQDYSCPLTPLIPGEVGTSEGRLLMTLLDQYAVFQRQLIGKGLFDGAFKLDNLGFNPSITGQDFSEYLSNREAAEEAIRAKKWELVARYKEYTQLTPNMQDYFNAKMEEALPPSIIDSWGDTTVDKSLQNCIGNLEDIVWGSCVKRVMSNFYAQFQS